MMRSLYIALRCLLCLTLFATIGCTNVYVTPKNVTSQVKETVAQAKQTSAAISVQATTEITLSTTESDLAMTTDIETDDEENNVSEDAYSPYRLEVVYQDSLYWLEVPLDDWHFRLYRKMSDRQLLIYDLAKDDVRHQFTFHKAPKKMAVADRDLDGLEEFYLFFEDEIGEEIMLILNYRVLADKAIDDCVSVYLGYQPTVPDYLDVDGDGKKELITNHPGGGGYVILWTGMDLINTYDTTLKKYEFSYWLSRKHYRQMQALAEENELRNASVDDAMRYLEGLATQGDAKACHQKFSVFLQQGMTFNLEQRPPYDTYQQYVFAKADFYQDVWYQLLAKDKAIEKIKDNAKDLPLTERDFNLPAGVNIDMSYDDFYVRFNSSTPCRDIKDENGNSTGLLIAETDSLKAIFQWSPINSSSPVLVEYMVKDDTLKTARNVAIGQDVTTIISAYGKPDDLILDYIIYELAGYSLVFEIDNGVLTRYWLDNDIAISEYGK